MTLSRWTAKRSRFAIVLVAIPSVLGLAACSPFATGAPPVDAGSSADSAAETAPQPLGSFFYTSLAALRSLWGSPNGFGGDLRFGMPTGLEAADKICQTIAAGVGFGGKTWRA